MSGHLVLPGDHEKREWFRLSELYDAVAAKFIVDINQYLTQQKEDQLEKAVDRVVIAIGTSSARTYAVPFRAMDYVEFSNEHADRIDTLLSPSAAKKAVKRMLPPGTDFLTAQRLSDLPGLDAAAAVRVQKYRAQHPNDRRNIDALIQNERVRRVNLIARTETVRIGSEVLDKLWLSNMEVEKARVDRPLLTSDLTISGGRIPRYARKVWVTRKDGRVCQYCEPLDGITTGVGQYFKTIYGTFSGPPIHPQCLPGNTLVSARGITGATKRKYEGELITIRTLSGKKLSGTPNHPVLTDRGWVAIGEIKHGDKVISSATADGKISVGDNGENVEARIEDVAEAFFRSSKVVSREVPVSSKDFHGDGANSEVAIVGTNSLLAGVGDSASIQHSSELILSGAVNGAGRALFNPLGSGDFTGQGMLSSSDSLMGSSSELLPILGSGVSHTCPHGVTTTSYGDAVVDETLTDDVPADIEAERDALLTLSGLVAPDNVVDVKRDIYSGHVYNLETRGHWYIGSGIVTHNCRCVPALTARGIRP